jgi:hypothetical protein
MEEKPLENTCLNMWKRAVLAYINLQQWKKTP